MQLQNNMEDKVDSIKCITAWKESWRLRVKIVRLWFYTDPLAEDNEKLLHMILMDQNLDKIQATVKEPYISIFVDDLYVGGAFCMTSFSVVPNIGIMKMTHHRFKLLFQKGTTVIPEPSLQIRDSDFIGVITSVRHQTEVDYYGKKLKLMILEIYADGLDVASYHFFSFKKNIHGSLVSYINHDSFDWRRIRTIQLIQQKMENGFFFVAGKIKQVVGDGHWWSFSVKIIVEDSTSSGIFVLLNAAATKLFGKSCSVALDQFQKELNDFNHPLHPAFFEVVVGKELILKIEFTELIKEEFGGMFKVITILDDRQTGLGLSVDSHINDTFQAPAYTPICEADFHYSEIEKYTSRIPFDASIDANNIDEMLLDSISTGFNCATPDPVIISHANGSNVFLLHDREITQIIKKRCSALLNENPHLKQTNTERKVPPELGNYLIQRKMVFMIDPRPLGYQYNTSVYMVHRICDDMSLVNLFEAAASMHDKKVIDRGLIQNKFPDSITKNEKAESSSSRLLTMDDFQKLYQVVDTKEYFMDIGCLSEATVNMEKKMDDSLLDEEVDCASSMALPDSSSYGVAEHELQNAFKICMQHQSDPTSMH
ncbi:hypothetical protein Ahy_A08g039091 isoform B [Arachis hypogaea]|uniref:Replication protein A 70 kDa DNA-binding subunit B/D first OB fold domain-containing protein n=1 Tax=Arachis hypogaea TaxID=3818 RepID=A0A445BVN1_ARAHY|nr:hypothetical protein Ahy_A08g039091 isoform B [Arachis hypogaea]